MDDLVFATTRLAVRDFRDADLREVARMWSDPAAARFMDDAPKSASESAAWLERVIHHNRVRPRVAYNLAITVRGVDRAIGWVGVGPSGRDPRSGIYGVGYLLDSTQWQKGYMSEVLPGVAGFAFNQLGASKLVAWCHAGNVASARTLEKAGFCRIRTYNRTLPGKEVVECVDYELVADLPGR